jgi:hypothetical protein
VAKSDNPKSITESAAAMLRRLLLASDSPAVNNLAMVPIYRGAEPIVRKR